MKVKSLITSLSQPLDIWIKSKNSHIWIVLLGIVFRLVQYLYNRSLWYDELVVANKIKQFSFFELINGFIPSHSLAYPSGFLAVEKMMVTFFGNHEFVLRFPSISLSIFSILLFYMLIQNVLSPRGKFIALCLFSFSPSLILYSAEAKPYSGDVAFALLLTLAAKNVIDKNFSSRQMLILCVLGSILTWFSHPTIFVLAGVALYLLTVAIKQRRWETIRKVIFVAALWLLSFSLNYILVLKSFSNQNYLSQFWTKFFLPVFPFKFVNIIFYYTIFLDVFRYTVSARFPFVCSILFLVGCWRMFYNKHPHLYLFILPITFTLLASMLHIYPFFERLILFLVPFYIVFIAEGCDIVEKIKYRNAHSFLVLLLVLPAFFTEYSRVWNPTIYSFEDSRAVIQYIKEHKHGTDNLILPSGSLPAFHFYFPRLNFTFPKKNIKLWDPSLEIRSFISPHPPGVRYWVFLTHIDPNHKESILKDMHEQGTLLDSFSRRGASAYLFRMDFNPE